MAEPEVDSGIANASPYIRTGSSVSYMFEACDEEGNTERKRLLEESNNIPRHNHLIDNEISAAPYYGSVEPPIVKSASVTSEFRNGQGLL